MTSDVQGYDFRSIEPKWQQYWEQNHSFRVLDDDSKPKFYALDMFPYPSGEGLHVGHPEGYTATDIVARYKRMRGYDVLHPMGWDAFGLPAEQHAMQTGQHPRDITARNIDTFRRQIRSLGFSYDWDREISTTDPQYYRWTQWIFLKLYERGLAYVDDLPVNWCPALGTVLANEEVIDGLSERGSHPVERVMMRQWVLRITAYAERLLEDLEPLDWPESIKEMQRHWIGKSVGTQLSFVVEGTTDATITVFTTRPDTLYGVTFCVLAPEHPLVTTLIAPECQQAVDAFLKRVGSKSDLERTDLAKEKTGVFTGAYAIHPVTGARIPIWLGDYVLATVGSGAIMAVPAHDQRDYEFAQRYALPVIEVVQGGCIEEGAYTGDGPHVRSGILDGLHNKEAIVAMNAWLVERGIGAPKVTYRLRDWLFSRQRYWGEPIPIAYAADGTMVAYPESLLPLELPMMDEITPTGTGESPLAQASEWVRYTDAAGQTYRRETNTMPQWAGSCWYYLRFIDPYNTQSPCDFAKQARWLPVDLYIGGAEHAVLHLLYARFWHKVLYDIGVVSTPEPFYKLVNQGMILGNNGEKMSKSKGNVINPDDIVRAYGADTLRLYEMFMGPLEQTKPWNTQGVEGVHRFLHRVWRLCVAEHGGMHERITEDDATDSFRVTWHRTIVKVTEDVETLRLNTAISQMMIFVNEAYKLATVPRDAIVDFVRLLAPFAPHMAEELWQKLGHTESLTYAPWPVADETVLQVQTVELAVQINGKLICRWSVAVDLDEQTVHNEVVLLPEVQAALAGREVRRVIVAKGRLVNLVV